MLCHKQEPGSTNEATGTQTEPVSIWGADATGGGCCTAALVFFMYKYLPQLDSKALTNIYHPTFVGDFKRSIVPACGKDLAAETDFLLACAPCWQEILMELYHVVWVWAATKYPLGASAIHSMAGLGDVWVT